ncbi:MAG: hypothetical protein FWG99_01750 [Treponema sp.]|nr:hypothetical protein [Treponema sp.]
MKQYRIKIMLFTFAAAAICTTCGGSSVNGETSENGGYTENGSHTGSEITSEKEFLEHFGKGRLLIGAMANDPFFAQNPNLLDVRYLYLSDAIFTGPAVPTQFNAADERWWGWWQDRSRPPGQYLRDFLNKTEQAGQIPMITYYTFAQTSGRESQVSPANDVSFLTRYFNDWRFMLQQIGNCRAIIHIEPDLWGYAQHRIKENTGNDNDLSPEQLPARVRDANPADGAGFNNTFAGFTKCLIYMARKYAPNALVGLHASAWATGSDININRNPGLNIKAHAALVGNFMLELGAGEADFLAVEALDRDADYYQLRRGENRWWNTNSTLPNFAQHFQWAAELKTIIGKPLVWWQLPVGYSGSPNIDAVYPFTQGHEQGYKDNRADYFLTHTNDIVSMGGVLIAFGAGADTQTNPLTDGGNLARLIRNYKQSTAGYGY